MESKQIVALALAATVGAAAAMTTSALVREAPGAKVYGVHLLEVAQSTTADGGKQVTVTACGDVSLVLNDGGTASTDLGCVPCEMDKPSVVALQTLMTTATSCVQNAP